MKEKRRGSFVFCVEGKEGGGRELLGRGRREGGALRQLREEKERVYRRRDGRREERFEAAWGERGKTS